MVPNFFGMIMVSLKSNVIINKANWTVTTTLGIIMREKGNESYIQRG